MPPTKKQKNSDVDNNLNGKERRTESPQPSTSTCPDTGTDGEENATPTSATTSSEDTLVTGTKSIAVIFTKEQRRTANRHASSLRKGEEVVVVELHPCNDIQTFERVDIEKYSRLDILVDTHMCAILMMEEDLHESAKEKFYEMDEKYTEGEINLLDCFAQDFELLFHRLPVNIRNVIKHGGGVSQNVNTVAGEYVNSSTGMTGNSRAAGGNVTGFIDGNQINVSVTIVEPFGSSVGEKREKRIVTKRKESTKSVDTASNDPTKLDMNFHVPKEKENQILSKLTENKENIEQKVEGVRQVEVNKGSIILTLILTKGHTVTEKWVENVLRMLCEDILMSCLSDDETFDVDVQRRVQYNFIIPMDSKLHQNCIRQIEHEKQIQELIDQQKGKNVTTFSDTAFRTRQQDDVRTQLLTCKICFGLLHKPLTLSCEHSFCQGCITKTLQSQTDESTQSIKCPMCRQTTPVPDPAKPKEKWAEQIRLSHVIRNLMDLFLDKRDIPDSSESREEDPSVSTKDDPIADPIDPCLSTDLIKKCPPYDAIKVPFIDQVYPKQILPHLPLSMGDKEVIDAACDKSGHTEATEILLEKTYEDWGDFHPQALRKENVGMAFIANIMNVEKMKVQEMLHPTSHKSEASKMTWCPDLFAVGEGSSGNFISSFTVLGRNSAVTRIVQHQLQQIKERTIREVEYHTKGMIQTSTVNEIMDKIEEGDSYILLQGRRGSGKTTAAFMVLKEMHNKERNVFNILTTEEFSAVTSTSDRPIVLLDSIFGHALFDRFQWLKWKPSLQEHNNGTVIIVVSNDILCSTSAQVEMGGFLTSDFSVVDMSRSREGDLEENIRILKASTESKGIISSELYICSVYKDLYLKEGDGSIGFPLICRLLAKFNTADQIVKDIISSPLKYLNKTIKQLLKSPQNLNVLKMIIRMDGQITIIELNKLNLTKAAEGLEGTLLRTCNDYVVFDHPVIYDSVAFALIEIEPRFVIQKCSLTFICQHVRFATTVGTQLDYSNSGLVAEIPWNFTKILALRYASELTNRNLLQVLSDKFLTNEVFTKEMIAGLEIPLSDLITYTDINSGQGFLSLMASSKSVQLLKCIDETKSLELNEMKINSVLYGSCVFAAAEVMTYLTETWETLDVNVHYGNRRKTALMAAAESRDYEFVCQVLSLNPDLNASDWEGKRILHYLSGNGLDSVAKRVIEKGNDVNVKDCINHCPLYYACKKGYLKVMQLLLDHGAKMDEHGISLLHCACVNNRPKALYLLLERGANINNRDEKGQTPLHRAAERGSKQCIDAALKAGADVNAVSDDGNSPLHKAATSGSADCLKLLTQAGSHLTLQNRYGNTPLHITTETGFQMCTSILLGAGSDVNLQNKAGDTPLHKAAAVGSVECVDMLIKHDSDVNTQNREGSTPLLNTIQNRYRQCADLLVCAGADVNLGHIKGNTPLHEAAEVRSESIVKILLNVGVDLNIQDKYGQTPLHRAAEMTTLLQDETSSEICTKLVEHGSDVNIQDADGNTALHFICDSNEEDLSYKQWLYQSPGTSLKDRLRDLVTLFVKKGANVNIQNKNGDLSLHGWLKDQI